jgi:hypothetical protein
MKSQALLIMLAVAAVLETQTLAASQRERSFFPFISTHHANHLMIDEFRLLLGVLGINLCVVYCRAPETDPVAVLRQLQRLHKVDTAAVPVRGHVAHRVPPALQELRQVHRRQRRHPLRVQGPHRQLLPAPLHAGRVDQDVGRANIHVI